MTYGPTVFLGDSSGSEDADRKRLFDIGGGGHVFFEARQSYTTGRGGIG